MNPKDRMAMMMAGMDGTPDRQAPMPTEGDNYGYASGPPGLAPDPRKMSILRDAFMAAGYGGLSAAMATEPSMLGKAFAPVFGLGAAVHADDAIQGYRARSGNDRYSRQADSNLDQMRYYGHDNLRGPR